MTAQRDKFISIHAPREGSDRLPPDSGVHPRISIHAPREGSDLDAWHYADYYKISIHAPREGSHIGMGRVQVWSK